MGYEVCVQTRFEAAHRLIGVDKCNNIHGHSYKVKWYFNEEYLDSDKNWIQNFSILKKYCKAVTNQFDHSLILEHEDPLVELLVNQLGDAVTKVVAVDKAPTAEYLARVFYDIYKRACGDNSQPLLVPTCVRVYETATNYASYTR